MIKTLQSSRRGGFTLIELLVVILILAILMAVALPLYLNSQKNAERQTCRSNMQTIANAVQAAKVSGRLSNYSTFVGAVSAALEPDLGSPPLCPTTGTNTYTIALDAGTGGFIVKCSNAGHGQFEPGVDAS